jgi:carboxyl-terminal processing protease
LQATRSAPPLPGARPTAVGILLLLGWAVGQVGHAEGGTDAKDVQALRIHARQLEHDGNWERACQAYDLLLRIDRYRPEVKARLLHCLRRYYQASRQKDDTYRKEVLTLGYPEALKIYHYVLTCLHEASVERRSVSSSRLFRKGLEEFGYALADRDFLQFNLPGASPGEVDAFRAYLRSALEAKVRGVRNPQQAVNLVREVAMESLSRFNLNATTVVMEFTCGACYAIDDYTTYLTPAQLRELCDSLKGEPVGVGLRLAAVDGKLVLADVLPGSPAAEVTPPLLKGDVLVSIDHRPAADLLPETAMALLQGEAGSKVELEIHSAMLGPLHPTLRRRPVFVPSVSAPQFKWAAIGYVQVSCFQDTTPQEIDAALGTLHKMGARALILDLRGNGGGRFEAAIDTARRFLSSGTITSTQHPDPRQNTVYQARGPAAWTLPVVVLIDGDTASAAEVLAGALKENKLARLVGQPTYGKGCIQGLLRLCPRPGVVYPGGLRLTVARFCSPSGQPYSGRGVLPDLNVERPATYDSRDPLDSQLEEALWEAQRQLDRTRPKS